jgi:hypothetical protein
VRSREDSTMSMEFIEGVRSERCTILTAAQVLRARRKLNTLPYDRCKVA